MTLKSRPLFLVALLGTLVSARADVVVDVDTFGQSLGGWMARKGKAAEYEISEAGYRTYQPEVSPSPDGGIFVSVRIDHRRGFFASDDHASLELSFAPDGTLVSAQSSLALQGRTISSELIKGGASASTSVAAPQIDRAVKVGTDLVADLTSKLLREKIVEPGRVSFPAAIRHNYNLLYKAVKYRSDSQPQTPAAPPQDTAGIPAAATPPATPSAPSSQPPQSSPPASGQPAQPPAPAGTAPASSPAKPADNSPLVPTRKADAPAPAKAPAAQPPAAPPPAAPPTTTSSPETGSKPIPLPDIKAYNPSGAPSTPLPNTPAKEKSLLMQHGGEVLKLARDVVKTAGEQ